MHIETERRFLLKGIPANFGEFYPLFFNITQYYLKDKSRIRGALSSAGEKYYLTRKKRISDMSFEEDEHEIGGEEFANLMKEAERYVRKYRIVVKVGDLYWEIDDFQEPGKIAIAEIEIPTEDTPVEIPEFLKQYIIHEITGDSKFTNFALSVPVKEN